MWNWIRAARVLRERGVLGMNRRNADLIGPSNSRAAMRAVDDKFELHRRCAAAGIPSPRVLAAFDSVASLRSLPARLAGYESFVLKPARGSGGRGILGFRISRSGHPVSDFGLRVSDGRLTWSNVIDHAADILAGIFSLGGDPDIALAQERLGTHSELADISPGGIPDIRVIVYRREPAMAMLRLPTRESGGRANLHQGGIGVAVDLVTGRTTHAILGGRSIHHHPDTGGVLVGRRVPGWFEVLAWSRQVAEVIGIGFCGVDVVIDPERGPLILEVNGRPGLAIQSVNRAGLLPRLESIDRAVRDGRSGGSTVVTRVA